MPPKPLTTATPNTVPPHTINEGSRVRAIVNPSSGGGRTGRQWEELHVTLNRAITPLSGKPVEVAMTEKPGDAIRLTAEALNEGVDQIIAVGGDGTIHECVNGLFDTARPIRENAVLSIMNAGTGGDYRRTFSLPLDPEEAAEICARGDVRKVDVGRVSFVADDGSKQTRYFNNIASFGLSGHVDRAVNRSRWPKMFGGKFAFAWATFWSGMRYNAQAVRIKMEDRYDEIINVSTAAVAIGQYCGGSMHMAPMAEPDDGLFDVVIMADTGFGDLVRHGGELYKGTHIQNPNVIATRTRTLLALPVNESDEVLIDVDGEAPGRLPASFEILPNALNLRT